ncbi:MAG: spore coat protein U domain-containing protein [Polaromonas sp.]|nr:spore coat protein U domain-containing protein [Polaromonas sp.]
MTRFLKRCPAVMVLLAWFTAGQVQAGCTASSSGLAFGVYPTLGFAGQLGSADVTSTASISIACQGMPAGSFYTLALGPSAAGSGNRIGTRYLANTRGGDLMAFNLFTDANRTVVWGDGVTGALIRGTLDAGGSHSSVAVYGKIPAGQSTLRAGSFLGSMTITLTYNP